MKNFLTFCLFGIKALIFSFFVTQMKQPNFLLAVGVGVAVTLAFEAVMIAGRAPFMAVCKKFHAKFGGRSGIELAIILAIVPASLALMLVVKAGAFILPSYFPTVTTWPRAVCMGALLLFVSGALAGWLNIPFITWDWTALFKRQSSNKG